MNGISPGCRTTISATENHLSATHRLGQTAFRLLYPLAVRLSALTGGRSEAIMAAVWHDDRLLVVRHAYWRGLTLPGGHVEGAETPAEAAARELREEVGIDLAADRFRPFGRLELRRTRLTLLECRLSAAPPIAIDNREITAAAFMAPAAIACPSRALRSYLRAKRAEAQTA